MDELLRYDDEVTTLVNENEQRIAEIVLLLMYLQQREKVSQIEANRTLKEIDKKIQMLDSFNRKWVERYTEKAGEDGVLMALAALGILFYNSRPSRYEWENARAELKISPVNKALIISVIDDLKNDLGNVTRNIQSRARQSVREIIAENLRRELAARRLNTDRAINTSIVQLKHKYGDKVNHVITDSLGRKWKMDHYVNMLVNTKLTEVQNRASINEGISRGYSLGRITYAPNTTDACRFHQGRIICLDESVDAPYPTYDQLKASGQVFHPSCRHRVEPISQNDESLNRRNQISDIALNTGTRSIKLIQDAVDLSELE